MPLDWPFFFVWTVLYCKEYSYMSFIKASVSCFFSGIFDTWCLASLRDGREAWKPCLEIWYYWHAIYFIFLMLMKTKIFHIIPSLVTWYSWHQKYLISFIVWTPGTHDNTNIQMLSLITNIQDISIIPVYSIHSTILKILLYIERIPDIKSKSQMAKLTDISNLQNIPNITYIKSRPEKQTRYSQFARSVIHTNMSCLQIYSKHTWYLRNTTLNISRWNSLIEYHC